jgi:hypothetical protein
LTSVNELHNVAGFNVQIAEIESFFRIIGCYDALKEQRDKGKQ